jgi:alpha-1,2-mannosyltransferase
MALRAHARELDQEPSAPTWWTTRVAMTRPRTLWILRVASAALLAGCLALFARSHQVDFEVYRMGGQHAFGSALYSSTLTAGWHHLLFTYPPVAALLFWPVSHLSTDAGKLIWDAIDLLALTALLAVSLAAARGRALVRSDWRTALMLVFPFGYLLFPVRNDLQLGQINIVLVLMIVVDLAVGVSWRGKRLPQGVLSGLAAAVKLTPLIFLPYLLATRQWRAARNMAITFVVATGFMFVVSPGASWLYFTKDAFDVKRIGITSLVGNQTLHAAIVRAHLSPSHALVDLINLSVVCGGIALAVMAYRNSSALLGILLCAATGLLVSPVSWMHHYVWIVPALVWLVAGVDRPARGARWAAAAAVMFMVTPPALSADTNVFSYLRENSFVLSTLAFFALIATMLWVKSRRVELCSSVAPRQELQEPFESRHL